MHGASVAIAKTTVPAPTASRFPCLTVWLRPSPKGDGRSGNHNTYTINIQIPGGTNTKTQAGMEALAQQIVTKLRLAANIELTG